MALAPFWHPTAARVRRDVPLTLPRRCRLCRTDHKSSPRRSAVRVTCPSRSTPARRLPLPQRPLMLGSRLCQRSRDAAALRRCHLRQFCSDAQSKACRGRARRGYVLTLDAAGAEKTGGAPADARSDGQKLCQIGDTDSGNEDAHRKDRDAHGDGAQPSLGVAADAQATSPAGNLGGKQSWRCDSWYYDWECDGQEIRMKLAGAPSSAGQAR